MPGKFTKTVKKIDNESEFAADRQPSQPAVRENDANAERKRRSKKTVIILIAVSVAFVALYFGIQGIASLVKERIRREEAEKKGSGRSCEKRISPGDEIRLRKLCVCGSPHKKGLRGNERAVE